MTEDPEIRTTQEARAGETRGNMRYVLAISVALAVSVIVWLALGTDTASQTDRITGSTSRQVDDANRDPGTGQASRTP